MSNSSPVIPSSLLQSSKRIEGLLFALLAIIAIILTWRIMNILPLFTNSDVRTAAKTTLTTVADREGWLLSDILVQNVTNEALQVTHRRHIRGNDFETCYVIAFKDASLHSCDAKQS